jgi:glyoxylase-like metal-dependent hydrolase (beta-lactamase superfamily II)
VNAVRPDVLVGESVDEAVGRITGFVNCYVVRDPSGLFLIDTGFSSRAAPIRRAFERADIPFSQLTAILLTHRHVDHIRGAFRMETLSRARVCCHPSDAPVVEGKVPPPGPLWMRLFARSHPVPVQQMVKDGDRVGPFQVVHVPGHTPGSLAFYLPERKILFTGDAVLEHDGRLSLARAQYAWDFSQAVASIDRLRELPVEVVLPGHGKPVRRDIGAQLDALKSRVAAVGRR